MNRRKRQKWTLSKIKPVKSKYQELKKSLLILQNDKQNFNQTKLDIEQENLNNFLSFYNIPEKKLQ